MPEDEQKRPDEEELELPEEDDFEARRRQRQKADLPERAKASPLLRRIIVGGGGGKHGEGGEGGEEKPRVEIKQHGKSAGQAYEKGQRAQPQTPLASPGSKLESATRGGRDLKNPADLDFGDLEVEEEPADSPIVIPGWEEATGEPGGDPGESTAGAPGEGEAPAGGGKAPSPRRRRRRREGSWFSEDAWTGKVGSALWWWITAGVVCLGFVAALIGLRFLRPAGTPETRPERHEFDGSIESTPVAEFVKNPDELQAQLEELVQRFEGGEDRAALLRGGAESAALLVEWRKRFPEPEPVHTGQLLRLDAMAVGDFGFVVLQGERRDFSRFSSYFVKEGDEMLLDWQASEGFSEIVPAEVPELTDREPRMMRAVVAGSNFYTNLYPEEGYQCYTLTHLDASEYVWAFAERGSEVDRRLRGHVLRGGPRGLERRAVVKIRRGIEGSRPNQVELVEFLQGGWIFPPPKDLEGEEERNRVK